MATSQDKFKEMESVNPAMQKAEVSQSLFQAPIIISKEVASDATGELPIDIPVKMYVTDVWAVCTAANGSGTLTLKKGTTAVSSAIVCAVDHVLTRTATIDNAQATLDVGDAVSVDANGADDRGILYIMGYRL